MILAVRPPPFWAHPPFLRSVANAIREDARRGFYAGHGRVKHARDVARRLDRQALAAERVGAAR